MQSTQIINCRPDFPGGRSNVSAFTHCFVVEMWLLSWDATASGCSSSFTSIYSCRAHAAQHVLIVRVKSQEASEVTVAGYEAAKSCLGASTHHFPSYSAQCSLREMTLIENVEISLSKNNIYFSFADIRTKCRCSAVVYHLLFPCCHHTVEPDLTVCEAVQPQAPCRPLCLSVLTLWWQS